jgi:hypothetical protein
MSLRSVSILAPLLLVACGDKKSDFLDAPAASVAMTSRVYESKAESGAQGPAATTPPAQQAPIDQKLIRTGSITLEVGDLDSSVRAVDSVARANQGLVLNTSRARHRGARSAGLEIKVPADRFSRTLEALRPLGRVDWESIETEDVTKAYFDLSIRLSVKEDAAKRIRMLLDRSGSLADVLAAERELSRVVLEIEQLKGERRYYDERVAMSTIKVELSEPHGFAAGALEPVTSAGRESLLVFLRSVGALIYAISFALPWLALAALVFLGLRRLRARVRASRIEPPPSSPPPLS